MGVFFHRPIGAALLLVALAAAAQDDAANLRSLARRAEAKGDTVRAYLYYAQAAALDPADKRSWAKSLALRTRAAVAAKVDPGGPAVEPHIPIATQPVTQSDLDEARILRPPVRLEPQKGARNFDLKGDSRNLVEGVLKAYGIDVIFDADYQPVQNLRFRIEGAEFAEAMIALEAATASFAVPVSEKIALMARDTSRKRQELEHTMAVALPIAEPINIQEAQELARAIQQLMEIQKFGIDSAHRLVVIKDRVSKVLPALALFEQVLRFRPEVHIEVEFLEVIENSSLDLGLRLPTLFPIKSVTDIAGRGISIPALLRTAAGFNPSKFFAVGIADSQLFASMSESSTRTLSRAEMRSSDGQVVNFHIGDKYPILTAGYFGGAGESGQVFTPPPTFNFEDLGVVLKVTPRVQGDDEIGMDIEAEYKVLTGQALNGIPVIANRKFTSRFRVKDGEIGVVTGLVRVSEARSLTGIAGLAQIPGLGALFRHDSRTKESGQTLFVIRPRILLRPDQPIGGRPVWTGSEGRPRIPL